MQIAYELRQSDFTESYSVHRNSKTWRKWARRIFICLLGLFTAIIVFGFLVKPSVQQAKGLAPFFVLLAMWIWIMWLLPRWMMRRQFLGQPGAHGTRTLTLEGTGMHWRWNGGSSDVDWKNYIQWAEGRNQILFYTSPACFNILPKRAIGDEQLNEIRSLLSQNIQVAK